jgi:hypothetical protein
MIELALILLLLFCGAGLGGLSGAASGIPAVGYLLAVVGGVGGTILAYFILSLKKRAAANRESNHQGPRAIVEAPISTQIAFRARLANFLKITEPEVLKSDSYKSTMPFWSVVHVYWRRTTRSAQEIRAILVRIRKHLRKPK